MARLLRGVRAPRAAHGCRDSIRCELRRSGEGGRVIEPATPSNDRERWERRVASAEINRRRVNEAIERGSDADAPTFLCECGHLGCTTKLELSTDVYEHVRTSFERFVLVPGHEIPEIDSIVERHDGFLVVEKLGEAGEMARRADERR